MNTQERIQLIEAMVKVVSANQKNHDKEMVKFANEKIKTLTEAMTEPNGDITLTKEEVSSLIDSEKKCNCGLMIKEDGIGFSCLRTDCNANIKPKEEKKINLNEVERLLNDMINLMSKNKYFTHEDAINDKIYWRQEIGYTLEDLK